MSKVRVSPGWKGCRAFIHAHPFYYLGTYLGADDEYEYLDMGYVRVDAEQFPETDLEIFLLKLLEGGPSVPRFECFGRIRKGAVYAIYNLGELTVQQVRNQVGCRTDNPNNSEGMPLYFHE